MHDVGQSRRLRFRAYNTDGEGDGGGTVTLTVTAPDGTTSTPSPSESSPGAYEHLLTFDAPGWWQWEWQADGGDLVPNVATDGTLAGLALYPQAQWATPDDVLNSTPADGLKADDTDLRVLDDACTAATEWLHSRTWRRFRGYREVEIRPCCVHAYQRIRAWLAFPMIMAAYTQRADANPAPILDGPAPCGCSPIAQIELPDDVRQVRKVLIDGTEFDGWRLDSGRRLTRTDNQAWPCCANMQLPETETNTFSVHAVVGEEPLQIARLAAIELSAQFYLAIKNPSKCRISARVTQVQRQGATYTRVDPSQLAKDGYLGLPVVDAFLSQFGKRRKRALFASPDTPELARRKGPGPL